MMPGLFGWMTSQPLGRPGFVTAGDGGAPGTPHLHVEGERFALGLIERSHGPAAGSVTAADGVTAALYGHCYDPRDGARLDAGTMRERLADEADALLDRLEGAFHYVEHDAVAGRLRLLNDRIGIIPMYWHVTDGLVSFGPRLRHLARRETAWDPAPGAVVCFLSVGHFLGPSTQVRQARLLTPATILTFTVPNCAVEERRYWNLHYDPDTAASTAEHRRRLGEAIEASVALLNDPRAGNAGIFLSGGWDSRSILGAMQKTGRPPRLVITNGVSDTIPYADTWLAKRMAGDLDLPFRFCRRVPDLGPELWLDGVHAGEITTANNPENFGQHQLTPKVFAEIDTIMKGDVTWGSGDRAPTRELSIAKIVPYPLMDKVKAVLQPDLAAASDELYEAEIDGVVRHCRNTDWTDRRDYLWQMGGINRYILGLGISDEEHIQVRRPLLAGKVFAAYTQVPRNLRVLKNLFIETIATRYPHLFAYGRNHTSNIANYYHYMAPFVRERALAHLDAGHDLGGLLDRAACRRMIEGFAPGNPAPGIPGWKRRAYNQLHDRHSWRWHRTRFYHEKHAKQFQTSDTMLAFHIYLLLEWFHGSRVL